MTQMNCRMRFLLVNNKSKRIAVFQYEWPLQVHAYNILVELSKTNIVDFYYFSDSKYPYIDMNLFYQIPNVKFINIDTFEDLEEFKIYHSNLSPNNDTL